MTITLPGWLLHLVVTLIFVVGLVWALSPHGDYDFSGLFKLPLVVCLYLSYWVVFLAVT